MILFLIQNYTYYNIYFLFSAGKLVWINEEHLKRKSLTANVSENQYYVDEGKL